MQVFGFPSAQYIICYSIINIIFFHGGEWLLNSMQ